MPSRVELTLIAAAAVLGACSLGSKMKPRTATDALGTAVQDDRIGGSASDTPSGSAANRAVAISDPNAPPIMPTRYDNVGYAIWSEEAGALAGAHPVLAPGTFVEVTSLETGRTALVPITARARLGHEIELSGAAARTLGLVAGSRGGVRVRTVNPSPADVAALQAGQPAASHPDTPPVLLNPLRKRLAGVGRRGTVTAAPRAATPRKAAATPIAPARPNPPPRTAASASYYVQVAALSDTRRAQALARQLRGTVLAGGGLGRVRVGPFADQCAAQAARDGLARRGYGDARIVRQD